MKELTSQDIHSIISYQRRLSDIYSQLIYKGCKALKSQLETVLKNCTFIRLKHDIEIYYNDEINEILIYKFKQL